MYIAQIGAAGELIVIDVRDAVERQVGEEDLHVGQAADADAARPELALGLGVVGVVAVERRHVVGDRQAGLAGREQRLEPGVRVLGGPEAGEHAHRPEAAAVAGWVDAAGERRLAGQADVAERIEVVPSAGFASERLAAMVDGRRSAAADGIPATFGLPRPRPVEPIDLGVADRAEADALLGRAIEGGPETLRLPRPDGVPTRSWPRL